MNPQKVIIMGMPGSGKSTYAKRVSEKYNLPLYHLDKIMFSGGIKREREEILRLQNEIISKDMWIIEGCGVTTLDLRCKEADTLIYIDTPLLTCFYRLIKRSLFGCKNDSGCLNSINMMLLKYTWYFNRVCKPKIEETLKKHPHLNVHYLKDEHLNF